MFKVRSNKGVCKVKIMKSEVSESGVIMFLTGFLITAFALVWGILVAETNGGVLIIGGIGVGFLLFYIWAINNVEYF